MLVFAAFSRPAYLLMIPLKGCILTIDGKVHSGAKWARTIGLYYVNITLKSVKS